MRDLARSMLDYDTDTLAAIAASRGIDATRDAERLRAELVRQGTSRLSLALLWEQLSDQERQALRRLAASGGSVRSVYFESEYGSLRTFGPGRLARERLWESPANTTERLYFLGLIFRGFEDDGQAAIWYVPDDVLSALPVLPGPEQAEPLLKPVAPPANASRPASDAIALAVFRVLLAARSGARRPGEVAARHLAADAGDIDEARLAWLGRLGERLAHEAGFLTGGRITPSGRARARRWMATSRRESLLAVARLWERSAGWNELAHAPGLRLEGGRLPDAAAGRQALVALLADLEVGAWYSVQDLKAWLRRCRPDFLRADADFESLYVRDASSGEPLDGIGAWMGIEGRFVDEVLFALNCLGSLLLGSDGDLRLFSPSPVAYWRSQPSPGSPPEHVPLALAGDLTIAVHPDTPLSHLYQVESFCDPAGAGRYVISRASLQRAEASGVNLEAVSAYLSRHAGADEQALARVRRLLAPPAAFAEAAVVLSSDDADALQAALVTETLPDITLLPLGAGRLLVSRADWRRVSAHLSDLGWQVRTRR